MILIIMLVYLAGFAGTLYYSHSREDIKDHDDIGIQCMMWPVFLGVGTLLLLMSLPGYFSKLIKNLMK